MVKLTRIYTRGGDKGETSLGNGARVAKHDLRVAAYGAVDEANAAIGVARLEASGEAAQMLRRIQNDLFDLGADLCRPIADGVEALRICQGQIDRIEREIDLINGDLEPLDSFVLPGGTALAAALHLARTITRRAERGMTALAEAEPINPLSILYINRLSDHLFVLSRQANDGGAADVLWSPGENR
jgi:cob(I)alamin adenosyltransferase